MAETRNPDALAAFWRKVKVTDGDGCWLWLAGKNKKGYGQFRQTRAHRFAFEAMVGEIPAGHEIDHLCRETSCVRPDHLEAVTPQENRRRQMEHKTHCVRGHLYTPETTYWRPDERGGRECRICRDDAARRHASKRQEVAA